MEVFIVEHRVHSNLLMVQSGGIPSPAIDYVFIYSSSPQTKKTTGSPSFSNGWQTLSCEISL